MAFSRVCAIHFTVNIYSHHIMYSGIKEKLQAELQEIREAGLYKTERIITSSQDAVIKISTGEEVINFCATN